MEERVSSEFWKVVQEELHSGAARALRDYFPRLEASLKALDLTSAYWSWSSSYSEAHLLLCGHGGFGRIETEMKSGNPPEVPWAHTVHISVLPWNEVTEITQDFIREGLDLDPLEPLLSKAVMCLRSGSKINLLPATDMDRSGGVHVLGDKLERFTNPSVFVGAVIKAQLSR